MDTTSDDDPILGPEPPPASGRRYFLARKQGRIHLARVDSDESLFSLASFDEAVLLLADAPPGHAAEPWKLLHDRATQEPFHDSVQAVIALSVGILDFDAPVEAVQ